VTFGDAAVMALSLAGSAYLLSVHLVRSGSTIIPLFGLVPLFVCIRAFPAWFAMLAGGFWGAGLCAFNAFLFPGHSNLELTIAQAMLLIGAPAVYCWLGALLTQWIGFSPFVLGVGWMGVQLTLTASGTDLGLVDSLSSSLPFLHWIAHALGYALVGFVVAYISACTVCVIAVVPSVRRTTWNATTNIAQPVVSTIRSIILERLAPLSSIGPRPPPMRSD